MVIEFHVSLVRSIEHVFRIKKEKKTENFSNPAIKTQIDARRFKDYDINYHHHHHH